MASKKKLPSNVYFRVIGLHICTAALFYAPPCYEGNVKLARMRRQLLRKAISSQEMYRRGNRAKASGKNFFPTPQPPYLGTDILFFSESELNGDLSPPALTLAIIIKGPPLLSTNVSQPPVVGERAREENECFFSHVHAGIFFVG